MGGLEMNESWEKLMARREREREEEENIRLRHREEISEKLASLKIGDPELPCQECRDNLYQDELIWQARGKSGNLHHSRQLGVINLIFEGKELPCDCPLVDTRDCPVNRRLMFVQMERSGIGKHYWRVDKSKFQADARCAITTYLDELFDNADSGRGLIISGPPGVGKTSILSYIYQHCVWSNLLVHSRYSIRYEFMPKLFNALTRADVDMSQYERPDILLLDDFGREYQNDFAMSRFEALVEHRYANGKTVIVTTNLSRERLAHTDKWERIVDRWRETCDLLQIGGESMRKSARHGDDKSPGGND